MNLRSAVSAINRHGILLVYPIHNRKLPASLWSHFFPRSQMRWEWDDGGDNRVAGLWHLREELARSRKVVYAKWYQGRATFFSHEIFPALLAALDGGHHRPAGLSADARDLLDVLLESSPLSTKQLKKRTRLQGRMLESTYERSLKELWSRLLVVGVGEVDDGAFPSLSIGATERMFEDLWVAAGRLGPLQARSRLQGQLGEESLFHKHFEKLSRTFARAAKPISFAMLQGR